MDPSTVTFENITGYLLELAVLVVTGLAAWGVTFLRRWIKDRFAIELDEKHAAAINQAIYNGLSFAKQKGLDWTKNLSVEIKNQAIAEAARYVERSVPDALRHHGLGEDRLAELILARIWTPEAPPPAAPLA